MEFKFAVFCGDQLVRWEILPNNANRYYRARYYSVLIECAEAMLYLSETIQKKFVSSKALESKWRFFQKALIFQIDLEEFKRIKKAKQIFNPFENAQDSFVNSP